MPPFGFNLFYMKAVVPPGITMLNIYKLKLIGAAYDIGAHPVHDLPRDHYVAAEPDEDLMKEAERDFDQSREGFPRLAILRPPPAIATVLAFNAGSAPTSYHRRQS